MMPGGRSVRARAGSIHRRRTGGGSRFPPPASRWPAGPKSRAWRPAATAGTAAGRNPPALPDHRETRSARRPAPFPRRPNPAARFHHRPGDRPDKAGFQDRAACATRCRPVAGACRAAGGAPPRHKNPALPGSGYAKTVFSARHSRAASSGLTDADRSLAPDQFHSRRPTLSPRSAAADWRPAGHSSLPSGWAGRCHPCLLHARYR